MTLEELEMVAFFNTLPAGQGPVSQASPSEWVWPTTHDEVPVAEAAPSDAPAMPADWSSNLGLLTRLRGMGIKAVPMKEAPAPSPEAFSLNGLKELLSPRPAAKPTPGKPRPKKA